MRHHLSFECQSQCVQIDVLPDRRQRLVLNESQRMHNLRTCNLDFDQMLNGLQVDAMNRSILKGL